MRVAIGEREAANALRIQRGENLRNAATAVVAYEIHLVDVQGIEKFLEHLRIGRHGYVLIRCDFRVAMRKQVHGWLCSAGCRTTPPTDDATDSRSAKRHARTTRPVPCLVPCS